MRSLAGARKFSIFLFASAMISPASATAGALTGASLSFFVGGGDVLEFPATGVVGSALAAGEVTLAAGSGFAGTVETPLDAAPATNLVAIVGMNSAGAWTGDPLTGTAIQIDVTSIIQGFGGTDLITVPFPAGSTDPLTINEGGVGIEIFPFPLGWTSGVMVLTDTNGGAVATATGAVVEGTPGSVTMVTGAYIETTLADPTFHIYTLTMDFERLAPEPASLLTLSIAGLALAARARRRAV